MRSVATTILCIVPALVAAGGLLAACEDGPNQSFSPASGSLFDNGQVDGSTAFTEAGYEAGYVNKTVLTPCSPDLQRLRWASMLNNQMAPPVFFAGLDLRGCTGGPENQNNCLWPGLSVENATLAPVPDDAGGYSNGPNCQGAAEAIGQCGEEQNDNCGGVCWGNASEVCFSYDINTHLIDQMELTTGYLGPMVFTGPTADTLLADGKTNAGCGLVTGYTPVASGGTAHQYKVVIGYPIERDGTTFPIDWGASGSSALRELYDAITYTYDQKYAGIVWPGCTVAGCMQDGTCLYQGAVPGSVWGARPLATYMIFNPQLPQPAASEPNELYVDYAKFVPNSTLNPTLALGQSPGLGGQSAVVGPFTNDVPAGGSGSPCQQQFGQTYGDYISNCIEPFSGSAASLNNINYGKLIGGRTHNLEEITFNVIGINEDFALTSGKLDNTPLPNASNLGTYGQVQDSDLPQPGDLSTEWYFDVRAFGTPTNELPVVGGQPAYTGSGLVQREYQRLVEDDLARLVGKLPSLPASFATQANAAAGVDGCNWVPGQDPGPTPVDANHVCTGMEHMVYPGTASWLCSGGSTAFCDGPQVQSYLDLDAIGLGDDAAVLKPGDHLVTFVANFQFGSAIGTDYVYELGYLWDQTLQWVTRVMGQGNIYNLPDEARDRRYYFKWFGVAMIKYLRAYGDITAAGKDPTDPTVMNPQVVAQEPMDLTTVFYDNLFATFDKFEYIDLSTVAGYAGNTTTPAPSTSPYLTVPEDYEYGTDTYEANQRYTYWYKRMDREELAMYQALSPVKTDPPGAHANYGVNLTNMAGSAILSAVAPSYECAAAQVNAGAVANGPGVFAGAANACPTEFGPSALPPGWLLDANGNSITDANGVQAANELAAGAPLAVQQAYHTVSPAGGGTTPDNTVHTLLWQYPGAFGSYGSMGDTTNGLSAQMQAGGGTVFKIGHSPIQVCPVGATNCGDPNQKMSVTSVATSAAETVIPSFLNPWSSCVQTVPGTPNGMGACDPGNTTFATPIYAFVPWTPDQAGIGFPIAVNGSSSIFVQTAQLDFTGNLESYVVDYVPYADVAQPECGYAAGDAGNGGCNAGFTCQQGTCVASDNTIEIRAIEATDFLGEVFACQDPNSGDVLHVGMYASTASILDWLAAHPGDPNNVVNGGGSAQTDCNIIVAYSTYDNYPDYITGLEYGVGIDVNSGQGFGRVVGATLFNPLYETINQ